MTKRLRYNLTGLLAMIVLIALDQWTKYLAVRYLKGQAAIILWKGVFELHYLENRGAAFGILQGKKAVFVVCTAVVLAFIAYAYHRAPITKRFHLIRLIGILLGAGAVGNMIDRVSNSYVVDFLYFSLIDFPIFNVADCYVTVGAVLMVVLLLFYYREEELGFLKPGKKEKQ